MGAAPLSWLAKIGGDTLKTKAKLLSSAINELHDDGQCKIVAVVDNTADNGKTVLITTDDNKTYSGTIANKKCEFLLPPKTLYTVQKVSSGSVEFTTKVEVGYGDCILVHLDTGYVEVKQGDIVGLDYIKAATADDLKNKVPEANAVKELNSNLTASDNTTFRFGVNENGEYGYIVTDSEGADTVIPFKKYGTPTVLYSYGVMGSGYGSPSTTQTMPRDGICVVFADTCGSNNFLTPIIKLNNVQQSILASYKIDSNTKGGNAACFEVKKGDSVYVQARKDSISSGQASIIMLII